MPFFATEKQQVRPRNFPPPQLTPLNSIAAFYPACRQQAAGTPTQFSTGAAFYPALPLSPPRFISYLD